MQNIIGYQVNVDNHRTVTMIKINISRPSKNDIITGRDKKWHRVYNVTIVRENSILYTVIINIS